MELESFEKFWKEWKYGLIEGLLFGIILMASIFAFLGNVVIDFLILVLTIPTFIVTMSNFYKPTKKKEATESKECPECGSTRRHKKSCSKGKKA